MLLNKLKIVAEHEIRESPFLSAQFHTDHAASYKMPIGMLASQGSNCVNM